MLPQPENVALALRFPAHGLAAGTSAVGIREGARPGPLTLYGEPRRQAPQPAPSRRYNLIASRARPGPRGTVTAAGERELQPPDGRDASGRRASACC